MKAHLLTIATMVVFAGVIVVFALWPGVLFYSGAAIFVTAFIVLIYRMLLEGYQE